MITLISGTNRNNSRTHKVTLLLADIYARLGIDANMLDLRDLPPALFLPAAYEEEVPTFVTGFVEPILASRGMHIVMPEYNGGFPGVLKYFIDMLPFPEAFEGRPVAFTGISAGRSGAVRPVEQLQMIYGYRNAYIYPQRVFIPAIKGVLNEEGLLTDDSLLDRLTRQAAGFAEFTARFR